MKRLMIVAALAALAGCAVVPAGPGYYSSGAVVQDPYQWHTVAVAPAGGQPVQYASAPVAQPAQGYATEQVYSAPVYVAPPVYVAAPYYAPYYYPPVSIGLDFGFGGWCCHGGWGRGYRHR